MLVLREPFETRSNYDVFVNDPPRPHNPSPEPSLALVNSSNAGLARSQGEYSAVHSKYEDEVSGCILRGAITTTEHLKEPSQLC